MSPVFPSRTGPALLAAAALGLAACGDDEAARAREAELRGSLLGEVEKVRRNGERTAQDLESARAEVRRLGDELDTLARRVDAIEARPATAADPAAAAVAPGKGAAPDRKALLAEMAALQDKVLSGDATDAEQQRFWELARSTAVVDELMRTLEAKVKERPEDQEARMQLAQAYIAKLLSIPGGPEQGIWSNRAVGQWQEVLKRDPDHWDARYSLAFNWSMWPDFLNKTPDAVREFEKVREVQERQTPQGKHAQTYLQLARLYQKQNKPDRANETLRAGLARHPDDAELKKALDSLQD